MHAGLKGKVMGEMGKGVLIYGQRREGFYSDIGWGEIEFDE